MNVNQIHKGLGETRDNMAKARKRQVAANLSSQDREYFRASEILVSSVMDLLKDAIHINLGVVDHEDLATVAEVHDTTVMEEIRKGTLQSFAPCFCQMPFPVVLYSAEIHVETQVYHHHMLVTTNEVMTKHFPHLDEGLPEEVTERGPCLLYFFVDYGPNDAMPYDIKLFPVMPLTATGMLVKKGEHVDMCLGALNKDIPLSKEILDGESPRYFLSAIVLTFFLKLLTCKNVELRDTTPAKYKAKPKEKRPLGETWEIVLKLPGKKVIYTGKNQDKPVSEIKFTERNNFGTVSQRRGHFKVFTPEKPLFGKHVGTWWWMPYFNTRVKNYRVERTDK